MYGELNGLPKFAVFEAHGSTNGKWLYYDGDREKSIQRWISSVDGKYSALVLISCNTGSHTPKSKKSILVVPDTDVNFVLGYQSFTLLVPKIDEVDGYTIDYEIKQLKADLSKKSSPN